MVLQNEKCYIEISIDETYTLDSTDNRLYDIVLNPCNNKKGDFSKTFSIHIRIKPEARASGFAFDLLTHPGALLIAASVFALVVASGRL